MQLATKKDIRKDLILWVKNLEEQVQLKRGKNLGHDTTRIDKITTCRSKVRKLTKIGGSPAGQIN